MRAGLKIDAEFRVARIRFSSCRCRLRIMFAAVHLHPDFRRRVRGVAMTTDRASAPKIVLLICRTAEQRPEMTSSPATAPIPEVKYLIVLRRNRK